MTGMKSVALHLVAASRLLGQAAGRNARRIPACCLSKDFPTSGRSGWRSCLLADDQIVTCCHAFQVDVLAIGRGTSDAGDRMKLAVVPDQLIVDKDYGLPSKGGNGDGATSAVGRLHLHHELLSARLLPPLDHQRPIGGRRLAFRPGEGAGGWLDKPAFARWSRRRAGEEVVRNRVS